jgi:hypothetical protein
MGSNVDHDAGAATAKYGVNSADFVEPKRSPDARNPLLYHCSL